MISYHDLRSISPEKARQIVRKVLDQNQGNVSRTAHILKTSRHTIRRARDGLLEALSRKPQHSPRKTPPEFERLITSEGKRTGFRYRRLTAYLRRKFGLSFSENTIKAILRRNRVKKRTRRTTNGQRRHLYDYETLHPFGECQLDTKHLLDQRALPPEVYQHMKSSGVVVVLLWLRAHNIRGSISIRVDNGSEFCGGSPRKLQNWNNRLELLGAMLKPIPSGAKHLLALVENAHRADDEYFLMIHAERCLHTLSFLQKAQRWQDTWNFYRPHHGLGMNGLTPEEKLLASKAMIHWHVLLFPTLLLESLFKSIGPFNQFLKQSIGGKYVYTKCLLSTHSRSHIDLRTYR